MFYKKLWDVAVRIGVTAVGCTVVVDIVNELMGCCGTVRREFWKDCFFVQMLFWVLSSLSLLLPVSLCCLPLCCFSNSLDVGRGGARADVLSQATFQHSLFLCVCVFV